MRNYTVSSLAKLRITAEDKAHCIDLTNIGDPSYVDSPTYLDLARNPRAHGYHAAQ
jgi:hypothetical protein